MKYFTSDLHILHKRLLEFCRNTRKGDTVEEMKEHLTEAINSVVGRGDELYILGDVCFGSVEDACKFLDSLTCKNLHLIYGNHDSKLITYSDFLQRFRSVNVYKEIKLQDGTKACLMHYPIAEWNRCQYGSYMLHGHCFTEATEVLTSEGFKYKYQITPKDQIATYNTTSGLIEYSPIHQFHEYSGSYEMVRFNGRNIAFDMTSEHRFLHKNSLKDNFKFKEVGSIRGNVYVPVSGFNNKPDYPLSDDMLRLYFQIATDGSFENSSLVRFHLRKARKIKVLTELLTRLDIKFSNNVQKSGTTKINFTLPSELMMYKIKPLDRKLLTSLSKRQVDILVETYEITDGYKSSKNGWQFSTSKGCEANLLQETLVCSGYSCNLLKRERGVYTSYTLAVNTRNISVISASNFERYDYYGNVWCLTVNNGTLITRLHGKVMITGNCHGSYQGKGRIKDVGVDARKDNLMLPFSELEIITELSQKEIIGHHN
jgi:calcineurin-like phosphoesterase family protein